MVSGVLLPIDDARHDVMNSAFLSRLARQCNQHEEEAAIVRREVK